MVAYSFQARFADAILSGTKDQTIRKPRKNGHAGVGDALQLYTGMRTSHCRLVARTTCTEVLKCRLVFRPVIMFDVARESVADLDAFARRDGFADVQDMARFWAQTHRGADRFEGVIVRWMPLIEAQEQERTQ